MALINDLQERESKAGHPNQARGIGFTAKAMRALTPPERSAAARFDGMTEEEILALPVLELLSDDDRGWARWTMGVFKVQTVKELLDLGWAPILARDGIGRTTLWVFTDAIRLAGLDWPELVMNGHRHPARPKKKGA